MANKDLRSIADIDFNSLTDCKQVTVSSPSDAHAGCFTASPRAWEDLVFYFLLPDRFSDGKETDFRDNNGAVRSGPGTPKFTPSMNGNAVNPPADPAQWRDAGKIWCGGNLKGLAAKLGYLSRMGVTAIWLGPVLKQVKGFDTYHGYAIQDFLAIDPHFGTDEDLRQMVKTAHQLGIYVVLDIVINHAANVYEYAPDRYWTDGHLDARWDGNRYPVKGFYDENRKPQLSMAPLPAGASPDAAIWPSELQSADAFTRKGHIVNWDYDPEFREGDFFDLKDLHHGSGFADDYQVSPALEALCRAYQYWIAYADLDGFRIDTVKHIDDGAARYFASSIHEFAQSIGKDNFYLIAEVTGSREFAFDRLEIAGLDAVLGIADVRDSMASVAKGWANPDTYFGLFRNSIQVGKESHTWFRDKVVTMVNDHDLVGQDHKQRFCADGDGKKLILNVLAMNATTLGIPCIYYGSEQSFDGEGAGDFADRYIRESMFGGAFGAFRTAGCHFFDENTWVYKELAKVLAERRRRPALRRGRQYLRPISWDSRSFWYPQRLGDQPIHALIAWSRILVDTELLCVMNTNPKAATQAWVTVDAALHPAGRTMRYFYSTDATQIGTVVTAQPYNGSALLLTIPAGGFAMLE
jgi:glycosidase